MTEQQRKLEVEFKRYKNFIMAKIIHQDENIRGMRNFKARNGVCIKSSVRPELFPMELYIRGNNKNYDDSVMFWFSSEKKEAENIITNLRSAIEEFNEVI